MGHFSDSVKIRDVVIRHFGFKNLKITASLLQHTGLTLIHPGNASNFFKGIAKRAADHRPLILRNVKRVKNFKPENKFVYVKFREGHFNSVKSFSSKNLNKSGIVLRTFAEEMNSSNSE